MTAEDPMMVGAATVFVVTDIAKSTEHYCDVLGFTVTFEHGTPTFYVCLYRDVVALHLLSAGQTSRLSGNGGICVFVRDVDAVHAELAARGARIVKPPQNFDYGMRDFDLIDLDGNQLTFGMGSAAPAADESAPTFAGLATPHGTRHEATRIWIMFAYGPKRT